MRTRLFAPLVALALVGTACGGGERATLAPETSTTTASTTTRAVEAAKEEPKGPPAPLTGLPLADPAALTRPALVVKIDNSDGKDCANTSRPQLGINDADVVFEIFVEGITRFAAVFQSKMPETVGPIRSARSTDVDILPSLKKPLFAWSGNNANVASDLRKIRDSYVNVGYEASPWSNRYYRVSEGRCLPHNLFVNPPDLADAAPAGAAPEPLFARKAAAAPLPEGQGVSTEGVRFSAGHDVTFKWNAVTKQWERSQNGTPHVDSDDKVLATDNLVVLAVVYKQSSTPGSLQAVSVGQGKAFVYMQGKVIEGSWQRGAADEPWALTDGEGRPIELNPGRTWVNLSVRGKYQDLSNDSLAA